MSSVTHGPSGTSGVQASTSASRNQRQPHRTRSETSSKRAHPAHGGTGHGHGKPHTHAKHHKHSHRKRHKLRRAASGFPGAPAPLAITASPPRPSSSPPPAVTKPITSAQARRLLWRAGFGPRPGQAE